MLTEQKNVTVRFTVNVIVTLLTSLKRDVRSDDRG